MSVRRFATMPAWLTPPTDSLVNPTRTEVLVTPLSLAVRGTETLLDPPPTGARPPELPPAACGSAGTACGAAGGLPPGAAGIRAPLPVVDEAPGSVAAGAVAPESTSDVVLDPPPEAAGTT